MELEGEPNDLAPLTPSPHVTRLPLEESNSMADLKLRRITQLEAGANRRLVDDFEASAGQLIWLSGSDERVRRLIAVLSLQVEWSGEYELLGVRIDRLSEKRRDTFRRRHLAEIALRKQIEELTLAQNLELGLLDMPLRDRRNRIDESLRELDLQVAPSQKVSRLGTRDRFALAMAQATITNPSLLIVEDPIVLAALGREILLWLHRGRRMVVTSESIPGSKSIQLTARSAHRPYRRSE